MWYVQILERLLCLAFIFLFYAPCWYEIVHGWFIECTLHFTYIFWVWLYRMFHVLHLYHLKFGLLVSLHIKPPFVECSFASLIFVRAWSFIERIKLACFTYIYLESQHDLLICMVSHKILHKTYGSLNMICLIPCNSFAIRYDNMWEVLVDDRV